MDNIKIRIEKLRLLKRHYDLQYWKNTESIQSDEIYDQITKEFNSLIEQYPEYKLPEDDELESIYMNTFAEVTHKYRMLSLGKCFSADELTEWILKFSDKINNAKNNELVFECKIDGLAICLEYENGILVRASTRGDGTIGNDITQTIYQIEEIHKNIDKNFSGELSGEIYMKKSSLIKLNEKLRNEGKKELKNVRNAAAGIARQKDTSIGIASYLSFLCYKVNQDNKKFDTYLDEIKLAKKLGFKVVMDLEGLCVSIDKLNKQRITNLLECFENRREKLDLDIDGVVIKINDKKLQDELGEKEKIPNWTIAYKFPAIEKLTTLLAVEWDFGVKDGRLTPMAVIEPVDIGGTTVKRPTLHNWDQIQKLGVQIGDTIKVSRRGDVIPYIEEVISELRPEDSRIIEIPVCPVCNKKAIVQGAFIKCDNDECSGKISGRIKVFVHSMEIDSLGSNTINKLVDSEKLTSIVDLFKLTIDDIADLDKMGQKSGKKIIDNINKSKMQPLWKVLTGLSIPLVGGNTAKILETNFKSLTNFKNANITTLLSINGMGNVVSDNIVKWLSNESNQILLDELIELNIGEKIESVQILEDKLNNSKIAFTGKLKNWTRDECKKLIISNGGIPWDIKKEINILLIGDGARSNKIDKAKKLGAKIITENEFLELLK